MITCEHKDLDSIRNDIVPYFCNEEAYGIIHGWTLCKKHFEKEMDHFEKEMDYMKSANPKVIEKD